MYIKTELKMLELYMDTVDSLRHVEKYPYQ